MRAPRRPRSATTAAPACCAAKPPSKKCCASRARTRSRGNEPLPWAHSNTPRSMPGPERKGGISKATRRATSASCCASSSCCRWRSGGGAERGQSASAPSASCGAVSTADLALFTRQLATLVRAGLPLEESLLAVSQQTEKPRVQSIMLGVRARGRRRPHPRRRPARVPAGVPGDLSRHGLRRRAVGPPR